MRRVGYGKDLFKSSMRKYRKSSIKPPGGLVISNTFEGGGGLIWGRGGGFFNLAKHGVIGSPLRPRIKNGKAQVLEVGGHAAGDQKQLAELPVGE